MARQAIAMQGSCTGVGVCLVWSIAERTHCEDEVIHVALLGNDLEALHNGTIAHDIIHLQRGEMKKTSALF